MALAPDDEVETSAKRGSFRDWLLVVDRITAQASKMAPSSCENVRSRKPIVAPETKKNKDLESKYYRLLLSFLDRQ